MRVKIGPDSQDSNLIRRSGAPFSRPWSNPPRRSPPGDGCRQPDSGSPEGLVRAARYSFLSLPLCLVWLPVAFGDGPSRVGNDVYRTDPACLRISAAPSPWSASVQVDSPRVVSAARRQQARFERLRRGSFARGWRASTGRCDETIGRFCLRHDDDEESPPPAPEPARVRRARERLIQHLDSAGALLPGDEWISGQRVRYLVEAGRHGDALRAARRCRASAGWWCLALEGYVHHSAADYAPADSVFAAALDAMTERRRCRWTDIETLLDGDARGRYRELPCERRASLERSFWWLADPLHTLPGNDRRTEHLARRVLDRMQDDAESAFGMRWGDDLQELLLRYGWPTGWELAMPPTGRSGGPTIVSHHDPRGLRFAPSSRLLDDVAAAQPDDWQLGVPEPRSEYAPAYAASFHELEHQLAVFPRGDSAIVVAAYDLRDDTLFGSEPLRVGLVLSDPRSAAAVATARSVAASAGLHATVDAVPLLLSLEAYAPHDSVAGRARYGLRLARVPPLLPAVSDLLLLDRPEPLPESLAEAIPLARGSHRASAGERLGLYWEVYGPGSDGTTISVSLSLVAARRGWLRKAVEWIGLADREPPLVLTWDEAVPPATTVMRRSITVDLPELGPGRYTLRLEIALPGREPLVSTREVEIT